MRKILLFIFVVVTFTACKGDEGPMGPQGEPGYGTDWYTKTITIRKSQWKLSGEENSLNSYYYAEVSIPELTSLVYKDGAVIAYIESDYGIKNNLPYILHRGSVNSETGKEYLWTQTYDFDFEVGYMTFYLTYSDFMTGSNKDDDDTFHIVLLW